MGHWSLVIESLGRMVWGVRGGYGIGDLRLEIGDLGFGIWDLGFGMAGFGLTADAGQGDCVKMGTFVDIWGHLWTFLGKR